MTQKEMDKKTEEYIDKLKELLLKSNEISTFYGKIIDSNAAFLHAHGIKASNDEVKIGHKLRDEFEKLKAEVGWMLKGICLFIGIIFLLGYE